MKIDALAVGVIGIVGYILWSNRGTGAERVEGAVERKPGNGSSVAFSGDSTTANAAANRARSLLRARGVGVGQIRWSRDDGSPMLSIPQGHNEYVINRDGVVAFIQGATGPGDRGSDPREFPVDATLPTSNNSSVQVVDSGPGDRGSDPREFPTNSLTPSASEHEYLYTGGGAPYADPPMMA